MNLSKLGLWVYTLPNRIIGGLWAKTSCTRGAHKWVKSKDTNRYASYPYIRTCSSCNRKEHSSMNDYYTEV